MWSLDAEMFLFQHSGLTQGTGTVIRVDTTSIPADNLVNFRDYSLDNGADYFPGQEDVPWDRGVLFEVSKETLNFCTHIVLGESGMEVEESQHSRYGRSQPFDDTSLSAFHYSFIQLEHCSSRNVRLRGSWTHHPISPHIVY